MKPDPRIDSYLVDAAPFAQPILRHLRKLVGRACPAATETLKWSSPFYVHDGKILCGTPAFKNHCALIFWNRNMKTILAQDGVRTADLRHLTRLGDLPPDGKLLRYLKLAAGQGSTIPPARPVRRARPEAKVPPDLASALKKSAPAAQSFRDFSPSHRREYIEWINDAKRPETRAKRLAETVKLLVAGKSRNWKYERC